ncbi:alpha/beta fold hydrolase [Massilia suwonensis]|uniref:Alpha/beta fold hydrolase n=1 Tax=Massilia suwonensis TaxID=648895 RepID=A0ABW0MLP0_9BURK
MSAFAHLGLGGAALRLEYQWVGVADSPHPTLVFLHEGLGSIALWKDFPEQLCQAAGMRGLVFSREGYGRSTPRPHKERWPVGFMHRQAWEVVPALLQELGIERPWLFGHSDGASIALLHAARFAVSGVIVAAPHIMVEDISVSSIAAAREAYLEGGLRARLARYHEDIDSAFWGWNDVWLDPAFRAWDIRDQLPAIAAPLLAIQGEDDEYGTLEQIYGIARLAPQTQLLVLPQCGHSPHRDQAGRLIDAATRFMTGTNRSH